MSVIAAPPLNLSTLTEIRTILHEKISVVSKQARIPQSNPHSQLLRPLIAYVMAQEIGLPLAHDKFLMAMTACQVIHEASLYHDDVIDEGKYRRGEPTFPSQVGNRIAVMQGDRFIAAAFKLIAESESTHLMKDFSYTIEKIIRGEILQNSQIGNIVSWQRYQTINEMKTGALFALAARVPFYFLAAAQPQQLKACSELALRIGTFYQYLDDFFDYNLFAISGKPPYQDFKAKKWTLLARFIHEFSWEGTLQDFWEKHYRLTASGSAWEQLKFTSPLQKAAQFLLQELAVLQREIKQTLTTATVFSKLLAKWKLRINDAQHREETQCRMWLKKRANSPTLLPLENLHKYLYEFLAQTFYSKV